MTERPSARGPATWSRNESTRSVFAFPLDPEPAYAPCILSIRATLAFAPALHASDQTTIASLNDLTAPSVSYMRSAS